jgi:uncharacterized RDD family membrane protein YckC
MIMEEYAGFWLRLGAYLIDSIILWVISWIITAIGTGWGAAMAGGIIGVAYFVCFWAWRGQTPGKMLLKVKVVRTNGAEIGWGRAFLRYLGYIICEFTLYFGFIWVAFDKRKQGLHDKLADTYVIRLPETR